MHRHTEPGQGGRRRLNKALISGLALLGVGAVAGGIASTAGSASAATTTNTATTGNSGTAGNTGAAGSSSSSSSSTNTAPGAVPGGTPQGPGAPPGDALPLHGTVTAIGASSVTIKTSSGTATYSVTSSSDIEKNGKTTLSALAVGDNVAFSTVSTNGTTAIAELYAGNPSSNMAGGCTHGAGASGSSTSQTPA